MLVFFSFDGRLRQRKNNRVIRKVNFEKRNPFIINVSNQKHTSGRLGLA